jgi:hypothetical protein
MPARAHHGNAGRRIPLGALNRARMTLPATLRASRRTAPRLDPVFQALMIFSRKRFSFPVALRVSITRAA